MNCNRCGVSFADIAGFIRLDSRHPWLHCPLCGELYGTFQKPGVFFDPKASRYFAWVRGDDREGVPGEVVQKSFPVGKLVVNVEVRLVSLKECFFPKLVFFQKTPGSPDRPHFSPVKPEWDPYIRAWDLQMQTRNSRTYRVETADGFSDYVAILGVEVPDPLERGGAALLIWPNFIAPGWRRYYAAFYQPETPQGSGTIQSTHGEGRTMEVWQPYAEFDFVPESIVLVWIQDGENYHARYRTQMALPGIPHLEEPEYREVGNLTLGFDFGTTNTAAAAFFEDRSARLEPLPIRDRTLRLLDGRVRDTEITWLPQPEPGREFASIPSQLYFQRRDYWTWIGQNATPIQDFTIPYNQALPEGTESRVAAEFKWAKRMVHQAAVPALRHLYFNLALQLFLAELVGGYRIRPGRLRLVATYPLAFEDADLKLHDGALELVKPLVEEATGFSITLSRALDESHAAEACGEVIEGSDVTFYMDVGGGTADLCISQAEQQTRHVRVVDSIELGGEDVNRSVESLTGRTPAQLRREIRLRGASVYADVGVFRQKEQNLRRVRDTIKQFQRGLIEIAARFVAAEASTNPAARTRIGLLMLGSGWKTLFQAVADHKQIGNRVEAWITDRLREYQAAGILASVPKVECRYPADPKGVVAHGAARLAAVEFEEVGAERRTYLLEDVRVVIGRTCKDLAWTQMTPVPFSVLPARVSIARADQFGFEKREVRGPDGLVPLETVDFIGSLRGDKLVISPFSLYICDYYKPELTAATTPATAAAAGRHA